MQQTPSLEDIELFERLNASERDELSKLMKQVRFRIGEKLIEEGGYDNTLYVLISGTVEVYKRVAAGRTQRLATMRAPTVVGEIGLLAGQRAVATVSARTRVEGYSLPRKEFLELLENESPAAFKVVYELGCTLASRMAETDRSIARIITELDSFDPDQTRDFSVFRDTLIQEWSF